MWLVGCNIYNINIIFIIRKLKFLPPISFSSSCPAWLECLLEVGPEVQGHQGVVEPPQEEVGAGGPLQGEAEEVVRPFLAAEEAEAVRPSLAVGEAEVAHPFPGEVGAGEVQRPRGEEAEGERGCTCRHQG